jgi:hypothetical protein
MGHEYAAIEDEESIDSEFSKEEALLGGESRRNSLQLWRWRPTWNGIIISLAIAALLISNLVTALIVQSCYRGPPGTLTETSTFCRITALVVMRLR